MNTYLKYNSETEIAIREKLPVVALETTIISHGMPYPENLETAHSVENIIRKHGACPATIGIIDGKICIGMDESELEAFAKTDGITKVSRRDIARVVATKGLGATTVSGTMICAAMAGIHIFVTGGIGGVHRDFSTYLDISADLNELVRTKVAVVCSGIKSILDIEKTLEYLETNGVPVMSYRADEFPAFYTRSSGIKSYHNAISVAEVCELIHTSWDMGLSGGMVIANPIDKKDEIPRHEIDAAIHMALENSRKAEIVGKDITPYLLATINELTHGRSLQANKSLIKANAILGASIACTLDNKAS